MLQTQEKIIGIDLGTTYSEVAIFDENSRRAKCFIVGQGIYTLASAIFFPEDGSNLAVGDIAVHNAVKNPDRFVSHFKRVMGDQSWRFMDTYSPEMLSSFVLKKLKECAEKGLANTPVNKAVITVPACFGYPEREATIKAAELAGLEVVNILEEPIAAVRAYFLEHWKLLENKNILVFDLGGGTLDVTLVQSMSKTNDDGTKKINIKVLGKNPGGRELGGRDFNKALEDYALDKFRLDHQLDLSIDPLSLHKLRGEIEQAKRFLSEMTSCDIVAENKTITVTLDDFNGLTKNLLMKAMAIVDDVMNVAAEKHNINWNGINAILLVGGSTRMPQVKDTLRQKCPNQLPILEMDVDLAVAHGAAIDAYIKKGGHLELLDPDTGDYIECDFEPFEENYGNAVGILAWNVKNPQDHFIENVVIVPNGTEYGKMIPYDELGVHEDHKNLEFKISDGNIPIKTKSIDEAVHALLGTAVIEFEDLSVVRKNDDVHIVLGYDHNGIIVGEGTHVKTGKSVKISIAPSPSKKYQI